MQVRRPLLWFFLLAFLFGWLAYILAWSGVGSHPENNPLGPLMAVVVVASLGGKAGLASWWQHLRAWRARPGWYVLAIAAPIALVIVAMLGNHLLGAPLPTAEQWGGWTGIPGTFLTFLVLVGLGEEAGWTAFAAPRILARHSFVRSWAILAAIRIAWHLPLMVSGDLPWSLGILGNAAFQLLVLWTYHRTGTWLLAAVWHAMLNATGGLFFFRFVEGADNLRLAWLMSAAYALVAAGVLLGLRKSVTTPTA